MRAILVLSCSLVLLGCFDPQPPELVACSETGQCPPGQSCGVDGLCRSVQGVPDGGTIDARVDASGPGDAGTSSDLGRYCTGFFDCDSECMLDGPGGDPFQGFCTRECSLDFECEQGYQGPGLPACASLTPSPVRHCVIRCFSSLDCPAPLSCITDKFCDIASAMPPPPDAGPPTPTDPA
jgi:hypothetical protein